MKYNSIINRIYLVNYKKLPLMLCLLLMCFSGCLVGPKYKRPNVKTYTHTDSTQSANNDTASIIKWTEVYKDPSLTKLIRNVLDSNLDLLTAVARIEEARATYGISKVGLLPSFSYQAKARAYDLGNNSENQGIALNGQGYNALINMNWEIDLFGKIRHQKRSSWSLFLATENNAQALRISLISEAANLYFILRDLDNRLEISKKTVEIRVASLKIISDRFKQGYVSELDELQSKQQLAIIEGIVPSIERQIIIIQNSLRILTGEAPGNIQRGYNNYSQELPVSIPAGIPSELLQRRPDIIAAEQTLISKTEDIGVATALRFPSLTLTGLLGVASPELNTIIDPASLAFGASATLLGPIFEFGKNKRRVEVQKMQAKQLGYQYEKTVLNAFLEVDNSLATVRTYRQEHDANLRELNAATRAFALTTARYDNGYSSYLEYLNQQNNLLDAQLKESQTQSQQNRSIVQLFKALGGGWDAK